MKFLEILLACAIAQTSSTYVIDENTNGPIDDHSIRQCRSCFWPNKGNFTKFHLDLVNNKSKVSEILGQRLGYDYYQDWESLVLHLETEFSVKEKTYVTDFFDCNSKFGLLVSLKWNKVNWTPEYQDLSSYNAKTWNMDLDNGLPVVTYNCISKIRRRIWKKSINRLDSGRYINYSKRISVHDPSREDAFNFETSIVTHLPTDEEPYQLDDFIFGIELESPVKGKTPPPFHSSQDDSNSMSYKKDLRS